jgi:hypothetical protein
MQKILGISVVAKITSLKFLWLQKKVFLIFENRKESLKFLMAAKFVSLKFVTAKMTSLKLFT